MSALKTKCCKCGNWGPIILKNEDGARLDAKEKELIAVLEEVDRGHFDGDTIRQNQVLSMVKQVLAKYKPAADVQQPRKDRSNMNQIEWNKYVELLLSMATDEKLERGPTKAAFIQNLRIIADKMEELLP